MPSRADPFIQSISDVSLSPRQPVFPSPRDWRDVVIYEVMIDRFDDGVERPVWNKSTTARRNHEPDRYLRFQGGTLRGVTRRLDYIRGLGATAVWITPPFKQRPRSEHSYHGYAVQDFLRIDPRFGTTEDLRHLVSEAHRRDMLVLLDVVFDHAGDVFEYEGGGVEWKKGRRFPLKSWRAADGGPLSGAPGPDDAVWPVELQTPDAFFRMGAMHDTAAASQEEAVRADFHELKALDMSNPQVVDVMVRIFRYWIAAADVDGFRMDTFRHIEPKARRRFCSAIREYAESIGKHNFLLLGEVVGDDHRVAGYIGSNSPRADEHDKTDEALLDAAFDFPLHNALGQALVGKRSTGDIAAHWQFLDRYFRDPRHAAGQYVRFVENHDFGADDHKRLAHDDADPRLAVLGAAFILLCQGIPCFYYGYEQGFDGGGDDDRYVRECMFGGELGAFGSTGHHFFDPTHVIYQQIARLAKLRAESPVLRYGRQSFHRTSSAGKRWAAPQESKDLIAFSRSLVSQSVLVVLNVASAPVDLRVELPAAEWTAGSAYSSLLSDTMVTTEPGDDPATTILAMTVPPRAFAIVAPA